MSVPRRPAHPERWFRTLPDSSALPRPRLLARSLVDVAELDDHIAFYERLLGVPADLRMPIPDFGGLELAAVGNLLLIASARPFTPIQRRTSYSLIVPSLQRQLELLDGTGTTVLEPPERILPGARARVRYPDGTLAELVEHRPWDGERPRPPAARPAAAPDGVRLLARRAVDEEAFPDTVRRYETLLQATAMDHPLPTGARAARTAIIGNLLLIGRPTPPPPPENQPRVALLVPPTGLPAGLADLRTDDPDVLALPGGTRAEAWSELPAVSSTLADPDSWTVKD
ncbi:lactoylglutathione lyase [Streptomyces spinoverrucosus]|uniref:VOC family protein n=1 Tax=Streptomyces spinoverrucosus TaxID=284043 RepID=UPI0018C42B00|nr:lactoylglutathione lyase [Streptomyces spinoverrucosus]MBG0855458.1 lactoylglutathione lyase [Streptomyces spinoverrucosus]